VLVVDDTAFNIIPVKAMLYDHYRIKIETATNGLEACELYKIALAKKCNCSLRTYQLIIMDLGMPKMNG